MPHEKRGASEALLLGAHTSAAGGAYQALLEGKAIGATTIQLFTANQKQWKGKPLSEEAISLFHTTQAETGLHHIMSHAGYLINLGSPLPEGQEKSLNAFREEILRCQALDLSYLNVHPGAALDGSEEACLDQIVRSLLACEDLLAGGKLRVLLETTAGQGSSVGHRFEQLAYILSRTADTLPIGICLDTCHIFAAGYDIRTPQAWETTLAALDATVGLSSLYAFHLNDSVKPLGSRRDRHAPLGEGEIGLPAFHFLMTSPLTRHLPKYLETPGGCPLWEKEIALLRRYGQDSME